MRQTWQQHTKKLEGRRYHQKWNSTGKRETILSCKSYWLPKNKNKNL